MLIRGENMDKIRNIIINFTAKDRKNFIIADLPADLSGTPEKIFSDEFTDVKKLEELLNIAEGYKPTNFIIMYGCISECGSFEEPFTIEKHFDILAEAVERVDKRKDSNPLKEILKNLADEFKEIDTRKVFARLSEIIKEFFPELENLPESMQPVTDRDYLDLSIELYKLLYSRAYFMDYQSDDIDTATMEEPLINKLLEYKFNHYGHEIFGNYGFNIIDRLENGMIRIAPMTDEEIEVQSKLN